MEERTLAAWMAPQAVSFADLHENYGSLLKLVKGLLGVVPNCDQYMEIWPVSFRTYNLMVPNFVNLPQMLLGLGAPKDLVGLSLYGSSLASECPYCTAHCCSFAQRRGALPDAMTGNASPVQQAVLDAAGALGAMPHLLTKTHIETLRTHLKPGDVEWIVMGIGMMGFLNKFMDALGIPLEDAAIADSHEIMAGAGMGPGKHFEGVLPTSTRPPVDGWQLYLSVVQLAPGALRFDRTWIGHVPKARDAARVYLREVSGADAPLIDRIAHLRPRRALTAMLRENLDPAQTTLGLRIKAIAGLLFAQMARNEHRQRDARQLIAFHGGALSAEQDKAIQNLATGPVPETVSDLDTAAQALTDAGFSHEDARQLCVAYGLSPSPAIIGAGAIASAKNVLTPAQLVELTTWLSIQQLMHRLDVFYDLSDDM